MLWLGLKVRWLIFLEYIYVVVRYYWYLPYAIDDLKILSGYWFHSPYKAAKKMGSEYTYGETPIFHLPKLVKLLAIGKEDVFVDLGCGRGRTLVWMKHFVGARCIGIDDVDFFMKIAKRVKGIQWRKEDFTTSNLAGATVTYLYGTTLEDPTIEKLQKILRGKVVSVTYPALLDVPVIHQLKVQFPWGKTDLYIQVRDIND